MTVKAELAERAAECTNAQDYVDLAAVALTAPADADYARELLQQAEMQCQFPADYVIVATAFADSLADREYSAELFDQAADSCFEGMEYAIVGSSIAAVLGEKERGIELFKQGVDEITDSAQILTLAGWAETKLGDSELAHELYAKVEGSCKTIEDYKTLAQGIAATGDADGARVLYQKAERLADDMAATVEYIGGADEIFADQEWTRQLLEGAESEAQFPSEFVQLATGFKTLLNDDHKVDELLESGAEFAMSGTEHLDLARGYWNLKQDRAQASASYEQALGDVNDRAQLLELAKTIALDIENKDLAKKVYAKAESRVTGPAELTKLAAAVFNDTGDAQYASEIYTRAEAQMVGSHDLLGLGSQVLVNLGDSERASTIFEKALSTAKDFNGVGKVLDTVLAQLPDAKQLIGTVLEKLEQTAESTTELLDAHAKVTSVLDDTETANRLLQGAEDRITSLNEMKKVVAKVAECNPQDSEWNSRLAEKMAKREANQAQYKVYQQRESDCTNSRQYMSLANEVMDKLDDRFYSSKLFAAAQSLLDESSFDMSQYGQLTRAVDQKLGDAKWVGELVGNAAERAGDLAQVNQVAKLALSLADKQHGESLARKVLQDTAAKMPQAADDGVATTIKLATLISTNLNDKDMTNSLLERAKPAATNYLDLSALGKAFMAQGDTDSATELFEQAADSCDNPAQLGKLVARLHNYGVDGEQIGALYQRGENLFEQASSKLEWARGMNDLFADREGALATIDKLATAMKSPEEQAVLALSRQRIADDYRRPRRAAE